MLVPGRGEEVEDLGAEHVDAAVGQVRERLGRFGLLLKALDAAVGAGDHDPELARVVDPLGRQRRDPVVGLVELAHRPQVDVGQRVAGDDQEGVAEELGGVADAAGGAEQLLLLAVGEVDPELGAVAEVVLDLVREQCRLAITSVKPWPASSRRMCSITGRFSTGTIGFGISKVIGRSRVPRPAARTIARIAGPIASLKRSIASTGSGSTPRASASSSETRSPSITAQSRRATRVSPAVSTWTAGAVAATARR